MSPTKSPKTPRTPANRPKQRQGLTGRKRRSSALAWTWTAVGVVVAVVLVIVLVDTLSGSSKEQTYFGLMPLSVVDETTTVPSSVFNSVGISSPADPIGGFGQVPKLPSLTFTVAGKKLPGFIYYGAEYCPYCAATRWAIVAALGRFGTFSGLRKMLSSSSDYYPNTNTYSFQESTYTSKYIDFLPYEVQDRNHAEIRKDLPTGLAAATISRYNTQGSFPFLDIGNKVFLLGSPYVPSILAGESWSQIGAALSNPANYGTQAIIATANYITAGICDLTHDQPGMVCNSTGVKTAITALAKSA